MSGTSHPNADVRLVAQTLWDQCGAPEGTPPTSVCVEDAIVVLAALTAAGWRQVPAHLLPLLDLTADEIRALALNARSWLLLGDDPILRFALAKLTTTEEPS